METITPPKIIYTLKMTFKTHVFFYLLLMNLVLSIYVDHNKNGRNLNYEFWAEILYINTAVYKNFKDEYDKYLLPNSLKTL